MEHRAFHYGVLGLIGAAHLGLLMQTAVHHPLLTPPQVLPVIEMVNLPNQQPLPSIAPPRPATPKIVRANNPATAARPQTTTARPAPTPVSQPRSTSSNDSEPSVTASPATTPNHASPPATSATEPRPVTAEKPVASEQPYQAPTPVRGAQGNPKPEYPALSVELEEEGTVVLRVLVSTTGRALSVSVAKSSGYPRLDNSARRTVAKQWQFTPGKRGGEVVEEYCLVPVEFTHPHKNKS